MVWGHEEVKKELLSHPVFSFLENLIDPIASCQVREVSPGEIFLHEGKIENEEFFFLLEGEMEAFQQKGRDFFSLQNIHHRAIFGESAAFGGKLRQASVRAMTRSHVLVIPLHVIDQLAERNSKAALILLGKLHAQTTTYLEKTNAKTIEMLRQKKNMGIFVINLTAFLSLFSILLPTLSALLKSTHPIWITTPLVLFAAFLVLIRMAAAQIPLSTLGITKKNLGPSLWQGLLIAIAMLMFVILLKWLIILLVPKYHDAKVIKYIPHAHIRTFLFFSLYAFHAFFQELVARGALQNLFSQFMTFKHGKYYAIVLASLVFATAHSYFGIYAVFAVFIPGLVWGWQFSWQKNLFGVALTHMIFGIIFLNVIQAP